MRINTAECLHKLRESYAFRICVRQFIYWPSACCKAVPWAQTCWPWYPSYQELKFTITGATIRNHQCMDQFGLKTRPWSESCLQLCLSFLNKKKSGKNTSVYVMLSSCTFCCRGILFYSTSTLYFSKSSGLHYMWFKRWHRPYIIPVWIVSFATQRPSKRERSFVHVLWCLSFFYFLSWKRLGFCRHVVIHVSAKVSPECI